MADTVRYRVCTRPIQDGSADEGKFSVGFRESGVQTVVARASRPCVGARFARAGRPCLEFGHLGLASWGIATASANRGAPKAPIIPAQPSGLGNRTGEAKALKARSISILGLSPCTGGTPAPLGWKRRGRLNCLYLSSCRACEWLNTYRQSCLRSCFQPVDHHGCKTAGR